jgi:hypothetical protein
VGSARYHYYLRLVLLIIDRAKSPVTRRQFRLVEFRLALFNTRAGLFPAGYRKPTERLRFGGAFPYSGNHRGARLVGRDGGFVAHISLSEAIRQTESPTLSRWHRVF